MYEIILNDHIKFLVCKQETWSLEDVGWNKPFNETFVLLS